MFCILHSALVIPLTVEVFRARGRPEREAIVRLVRRVARAEHCRATELNIVIVTNPEIRRLNRRFLKHNRFTDVISFSLEGSLPRRNQNAEEREDRPGRKQRAAISRPARDQKAEKRGTRPGRDQKAEKREAKSESSGLSALSSQFSDLCSRPPSFSALCSRSGSFSDFCDIGVSLGEIYVSRDQARIQARQYGVPFREEILRLVLHGFLHLLGYTHHQMQPLERKYLEEGARDEGRGTRLTPHPSLPTPRSSLP